MLRGCINRVYHEGVLMVYQKGVSVECIERVRVYQSHGQKGYSIESVLCGNTIRGNTTTTIRAADCCGC